MNLPPDFVNNIIHSYREAGQRYLDTLPDLLADAARRWDLTLGEPFLLSYNYVCAATRADGTPAVLKVGVPNIELTSEINTLRVYNGEGCCRLYEADPEAGFLLLERLRPGAMLTTLADDDRATEIAGNVMKRIQRPVPAVDGFLSLKDWFDELQSLRPRFGGGTGPFPEKTFFIVEGLIRDLFAEARPQVLLHGDFHHYNVLSSERGWLVIDPKGVAGHPEYEAGPFLVNPYNFVPEESEAIRRVQRRIAILSERTGMERQRLLLWATCFSVLSSFWDTEADGTGGETCRAWTEIFLKTKI